MAAARQEAIPAFFEPGPAGIFGALADEAKIGSRPVPHQKLGGCDGKIYPIKRSRAFIQGAAAYPFASGISDDSVTIDALIFTRGDG
ncbi:MAG: hypothetical protein L0I29_04495 [Hyphomicrobiales bacterium]|nr:hypothetical protein [Hyphomicrobiales bacterium]